MSGNFHFPAANDPDSAIGQWTARFNGTRPEMRRDREESNGQRESAAAAARQSIRNTMTPTRRRRIRIASSRGPPHPPNLPDPRPALSAAGTDRPTGPRLRRQETSPNLRRQRQDDLAMISQDLRDAQQRLAEVSSDLHGKIDWLNDHR